MSLFGGPAALAGAVAGLLAARAPAGRPRRGALVALIGAGVCGGLDDLAGNGDTRGLRGHLRAAAAGRPTTGLLKVVGIGLSGLAGGALATDGGYATALPAGMVVAAAANVGNLFDLRPGRAAKVAILAGLPLMLRRADAAQVAGAATGAAIGLLPPDLGEQTMLGDAGANALGAMLGLAAVIGTSRRRNYVVLACLLAVTAASEVVSFSAAIDRHRALRFVDQLGRLPDA